MCKFLSKKRGFTLIELMVVIALSAVILTLTIATFASFSDFQSVDKDAETVASYLLKAKNETTNAKSSKQYGVKFASSSITFFEGTAYSASAPSNVVYTVSKKTEMSSASLTGGATAVYFQRVSGKPSATGTITYRLRSKPSITRSIVIYGSGLIESI